MFSFSSRPRHGHSHKLTSLRTLQYYTVGKISQMHRPIALPLHALRLAYLSEPLVNDSCKTLVRRKNHNTACFNLRDHITVTYVLWRGIRKHCTWRKWLTYRSCSKFITLLTFELSSLFHFDCIFRTVATDTSHWMPKSAGRQNRENGHTHTHTQDNYCNPHRACAPRVNECFPYCCAHKFHIEHYYKAQLRPSKM